MTTCPELKTNYSTDFDCLRVETTFNKIGWFREHGYNPTFPGNKKIADFVETQTLDELIELVKTEYNPTYYANVAHELEKQWRWFTDRWAESPLKNIALNFSNTYEVFLTSYGVTGSYNIPNEVIINVRKREHDRLAEILFHEMIHLSIEPLIQEHSIPHWHKERLVDLYYKRIFPEKSFEQNLPKEVLDADPIFDKYFSDPKRMIEELAKVI